MKDVKKVDCLAESMVAKSAVMKVDALVDLKVANSVETRVDRKAGMTDGRMAPTFWKLRGK